MNAVHQLFSLEGRIALVTGGSSGIGRVIAMGLAEAGAAIIHVARKEEELQDATKEVEKRDGKAAYLSCDLFKIDEISEILEKACSFFGAPDILVNAAGTNLRQPWEEITVESWDRQIDINLKAPFFVARHLVPKMKKKNWGRIINIASLQSERAFPNSIPYGASKGGVVQLTRAMAEAWSAGESGITCNAIAPGFFKTGLTSALYDKKEVIDALARQTIIGRNGELEDLKGVAIFLASPASAYITGQTIFVDGGWTAK
ncbi:MAG TPA: gluconate 5-dehydrogenase [Desulfofustis sp.]|jgi:NAD(P)-dependent dehydrogenase (short-subunit alcohol dehydrogenase family)|nr:SDR family oxidoreductase [Desulfofustis sp. PB-SRB1]HBH28827.1 gluconate 5-dehydrogenase [Desulfofustis sp.]HBH32437.1 gluconate 5-dehydrogenase [Desulfofustis sp.]